jgi:murein DD-endopeptidase MepM/ murein hydrolase activator NlpD
MPTKRVTIQVTADDIATAIPKDSGHCAIADAIARQIPGAKRVSVDLQTIRWSDADTRYTYLTPRAAQLFLLAFDQGNEDYCQPLGIRLVSPIHVAPLKQSNSVKAAERRATKRARVTELRARQERGEELTPVEKQILGRDDAQAAKKAAAPTPERPTSYGPKEQEYDDDGNLTVRGGLAPPLGALAHGRGRRRGFGLAVAGSPGPAPRVTEED